MRPFVARPLPPSLSSTFRHPHHRRPAADISITWEEADNVEAGAIEYNFLVIKLSHFHNPLRPQYNYHSYVGHWVHCVSIQDTYLTLHLLTSPQRSAHRVCLAMLLHYVFI